MATIIEFSFPTEEFALEETLDTHPEAHIEIERVVADDPDRITPYMWVRTDDFDAFEAALEDDPTVEEVTMFSDTGEERSYQMTWTGPIDFLVQVLTEYSGTITHADGSAGRWDLRVVFPDREALSRAYEAAQEAGFQFNVQTIYGSEDPRGVRYGLTETQRNTLVEAFEAGYFRSHARRCCRNWPSDRTPHIRRSRNGSGERRAFSSSRRSSLMGMGSMSIVCQFCQPLRCATHPDECSNEAVFISDRYRL